MRGRLQLGSILALVVLVSGCGGFQEKERVARGTDGDPQGLVSDTDQPPPPGGSDVFLRGRVTDEDGDPVRNAAILLESLAEPPTPIPDIGIATNARGSFSWTIDPGPYRITVHKSGYTDTVRSVVLEEEDRPRVFPFTLRQRRR